MAQCRTAFCLAEYEWYKLLSAWPESANQEKEWSRNDQAVITGDQVTEELGSWALMRKRLDNIKKQPLA